MTVPEEEIGISVFLTEDIPGIRGKIKTEPEDFVVEELSIFPPEDPEGNVTAAIVTNRNWEMNRLVRRLSTNLRISRNKIAFAGTKDKRSVATQLITFLAPPEAVATISIPDVQFVRIYRARTQTRLGNLLGNRFRILIRDVDRDSIEDRLNAVTAEIMRTGGFPNFFGVQRFGVTRPVTHLIGRAMVRGDIEDAVMLYLGEDSEYELPRCREARQYLLRTRDYAGAVERYPAELTFERTMLRRLSKRPDDFAGAIRSLPKNLIMMFVHAYQSYLFNMILSLRIKMGLPLNRAVEGDIVLPLSKQGLPDHNRYICVDDANLDRVNEQIAGGKGFVSGSLFGSDPAVADGPMGEIEREVIAGESLKAEDFVVPDVMESSSRGRRRELLASVRGLRHRISDEGVVLTLELNKGCYATSLLREYMKSPIINY